MKPSNAANFSLHLIDSLTIKHHFMWSSNTIQFKWSIFTLKIYYNQWISVGVQLLLLVFIVLFVIIFFQNTIDRFRLGFFAFVCYILLFWTCFHFFLKVFFLHFIFFKLLPQWMSFNMKRRNNKLKLKNDFKIEWYLDGFLRWNICWS